MKAQELRIGNLIHGVYENNQDEEITEVVKFIGYDPHELWFWVDGSGNAERYSSFEPIPLTEEWLVKFGFEEDELSFKLKIQNRGFIWIHPSKDGVRCELGTISHYLFCHPNCQNVHQLQNLYFALTGEELIIDK